MNPKLHPEDEEVQTLVSREEGDDGPLSNGIKRVSGGTTESARKNNGFSLYNMIIFVVCIALLVVVGTGISAFLKKPLIGLPDSESDNVPITPVEEFDSIEQLQDEADDGDDYKAETQTTLQPKPKSAQLPTKPKLLSTASPISVATKNKKKPLFEQTEKEEREESLQEQDEEDTVSLIEEEESLDDEKNESDTIMDENKVKSGKNDHNSNEDDESSSGTSSEAEELKKLLIQDEMPEGASDDEEEDPGENADYIPAPRTTTVEYNQFDPNQKYLLYNPSGGMSNQELELVNALHMAKLLGRILFVPMIGRHSNLPSGYNGLKKYDLFVADRLFDFEWMNQYAPVVPLNISVKNLLGRMARQEGSAQLRLVATFVGFDGDVAAKVLKRSSQKLIFFNGKGMWGRWWNPSVRKTVRHYIAYSPYMRELAMDIADRALGPRFYAVHGRLGDEASYWNGKDSGAIFVRTREFQTWDKSYKLYLASDDPNNVFFRELKSKITVITANDLVGEEVDRFRNLFPNQRVMHDMFGVLDKLICTMAIGFLGSHFSTFTMEIRVMRGAVRYVFPELHVRKHNLTISDVNAVRLETKNEP